MGGAVGHPPGHPNRGAPGRRLAAEWLHAALMIGLPSQIIDALHCSEKVGDDGFEQIREGKKGGLNFFSRRTGTRKVRERRLEKLKLAA